MGRDFSRTYTGIAMQQFVIYHMLRHIPPLGSVHITAVPLRTVRAATERAAFYQAKEIYAALRPHLAVGVEDGSIPKSVPQDNPTPARSAGLRERATVSA